MRKHSGTKVPKNTQRASWLVVENWCRSK